MDVQPTFAARLYDSARMLADPAQPAEEVPRAAESFADTLTRAAEEIGETIRRGEETAARGVAGRADVQSVVEALTSAELALQTAVSVRDRVVEAYQEILRMPV